MAGRPKKETEEFEGLEVIKESITEKLEKNLVTGRTQSLKKIKQTIDDEDMIAVASFASGRTQLRNPKEPYDEYIWEGFGAIEDVRFGILKDTRKRYEGIQAFENMLYVLDDLAVIELGLTKTYEKIGSLDNIIKIFDRPLADVIRFVDSATPQIKIVLGQILHNKLERKEPIDYFVLETLAEKLGVELHSKL